jgi:hypothetical protein
MLCLLYVGIKAIGTGDGVGGLPKHILLRPDFRNKLRMIWTAYLSLGGLKEQRHDPIRGHAVQKGL